MRPGEVVEIIDPHTKKIEGQARLVSKTFENDTVEMWIVDFLGKFSKNHQQRIFYKKDFPDHVYPWDRVRKSKSIE